MSKQLQLGKWEFQVSDKFYEKFLDVLMIARMMGYEETIKSTNYDMKYEKNKLIGNVPSNHYSVDYRFDSYTDEFHLVMTVKKGKLVNVILNQQHFDDYWPKKIETLPGMFGPLKTLKKML